MRAVRFKTGARFASASLLLCIAAIVTGCGIIRTGAGGPLPAVSPAAPARAPAWILRYGPSDTVDTLAQIRIEFKEPLIPLESLESPDEAAKLSYFSIEPVLPGRFRFLTPRLVGFQADAALPIATRVRVTVKNGLTDLRGNRLARDFAWTFNTEPLRLTNHIESRDPVTLTPTLEFSSNAELDMPSLERGTTLETTIGHNAVPIKIALEKSEAPSSDDAAQKFDPSIRDWYYAVVPRGQLAKATSYELVIAAGVMPAHGNLALAPDNEASFDLHTFSPLRYVGIHYAGTPPDGGFARFYDGDPQLEFNNPVTADSAHAEISIRPAPKPWANLVESSDGDTRIALDPAAFDPATNYIIKIGAGLKDTFGQTLGAPLTVRYNPGDTAPSFWSPSGLNIFPAGVDLQLQLSAVNIPSSSYRAAYKVVRPADLVYADPTNLDANGGGLLPADAQDWKSYALRRQKNRPEDIAVPLRQSFGAQTGMLAYGVQASTGYRETASSTYYGAVQLTNLGVFAQWFPASGFVRVHHLSDGTPAAGARVDVFRSKPENERGPSAQPCASALTDTRGSALFDASSLRGCMGGSPTFRKPPELLAIAHEGGDWSFARTYEWSGAYGYGVYAGWDDGSPLSRGTIYSDRNLYQQGEDAWFTGAAYYVQDGVLHQDANASYRLTMEDADGNKSDLGVVTTDGFGSFSRKVTLSKGQALGYYAIRAKSANGVVIEGQFRVAQFRPPNFKVALALDKQYAVAGSSVDATSQSNYLFGSPVEGGKATFYVTRSQTNFSPKGWDDYGFGRSWEWPETPPSVDTDVLQNTVTLGSDGAAKQRVDVAADLPYPMAYEVDAETTDVSNLSVADSKTFTALPDDRLIGMRTDWIATSGKPLQVDVVVTDPSGAPLRGQRVHVELQRINYDNVTQIIEGGASTLNQVEYKKVAEQDLSSGPDAVTATLTPPFAGSYRVRANFANAKGDATASDAYVWATGDNPVFWSGENPDQVQVKLDKTAYKPGDMATALVQSPYADAELYFAVIRRDTMYHVVRNVHGGAPTVRFRVTSDMLPNAAVEALLVRKGTPLSHTQPGTVESLARVGFAPFDVKLDAKRLKVTIVPALASVMPGTKQTVALTVRDATGRPVAGEFTVVVANEAVLQLSGYRLPDLVSIVYGDQDIMTRFADNRPNVVLRQPPSPIDKGWGFGGGFSAAAAGTRVRTNFQPLAYFNGSVRTDANGRAHVTFSVPDDLTTWRVMAVATSATEPGSPEFRFGTADATFVASKPLVTNALLPQFARPGDTFQAGVSVTNTTARSGNLNIAGIASGSLRFNEKSGPARSDGAQTDLAPATQAYRFPVIASVAGDARVRFDTTGAGMRDAFALSIPIVPIAYLEQVVESGVTDDRAMIPVSIASDVRTDGGGLDVSIASTLLPEIVEPARDDLDADCLPFLEPAATQLAIAADVITLKKKYGHVTTAFEPARVAAKDLDYIAKLRKADGGFTTWPGGKESEPVTTAYAAESLAAARDAGIHVDAAMMDRVAVYLRGVLANPSTYRWCDTLRCINWMRFNALEALSSLGDTRNDFLADIYANRDDFNFTDRVRLGRYLLRVPGWRAQGHDMAVKFRENVYETGRTATVNVQNRWWWEDSLTAEQALTLQLMIDDGANATFIDRMVQGLLALRRHGTWPDSYDDARALAALIDYGAMQPQPPSFDATASLGSKRLLLARFAGYAEPLQNVHVPMSALTPGSHPDLSLEKSGRGSLHYFASYSYALNGSQHGIIAGLRVIRYVRPANGLTVLWQSGLSAPSESLQLSVGQVFDIELELICDHPVDNVVITDPLPAGFEAVDTAFQTSTKFYQAATDSWQLDYQAIYRDRVVAFGNHLDAGDYSFHYLVRSVTPGVFSWPGTEAHLMYAPEIFGRSASGTLELH